MKVGTVIFSERDIDALRLLCWCQYIAPDDLKTLFTEPECENLILLKLIRQHKKSGALMLASGGAQLLKAIYGDGVTPNLSPSYWEPMIQRRLRLSRLVLTAYRGRVNPFAVTMTELTNSPALFLSSLTRDRGTNPWGSTRIAAIARLGDLLCAIHYICPGIGKLALTDELNAFTNQIARFGTFGGPFSLPGKATAIFWRSWKPPSRERTPSSFPTERPTNVYRSRCICSPATLPERHSSRSCPCRTTAGSSPEPPCGVCISQQRTPPGTPSFRASPSSWRRTWTCSGLTPPFWRPIGRAFPRLSSPPWRGRRRQSCSHDTGIREKPGSSSSPMRRFRR